MLARTLSRPSQRPWGRRILHHKFDFLHLSGVFLSGSAPPFVDPPIRRLSGPPTCQPADPPRPVGTAEPGGLPMRPRLIPSCWSQLHPVYLSRGRFAAASNLLVARPLRRPAPAAWLQSALPGHTPAIPHPPSPRCSPRSPGRASLPPAHVPPCRRPRPHRVFSTWGNAAERVMDAPRGLPVRAMLEHSRTERGAACRVCPPRTECAAGCRSCPLHAESVGRFVRSRRSPASIVTCRTPPSSFSRENVPAQPVRTGFSPVCLP